MPGTRSGALFYLVDKKYTAHFRTQGHHYQSYGKTEARSGIRALRDPRQAIETPKYLPHLWRTFRLVSREKVRRALLAPGPPLRILQKNGGQTWNQDVKEPQIGYRDIQISTTPLAHFSVHFSLSQQRKSAPRTFGPRATTFGPTAKRRPDMESGRRGALDRVSKHLYLCHTFGGTSSVAKEKVRFSLSQKCAAQLCPQRHHQQFYGKSEAMYGIRASRSPRQALKTPKHLPHVMVHFSHTFRLVSNR